MSKQYNKAIKRQRRLAYLKRRKTRGKATASAKVKKPAAVPAESAAAS